MNVNELLIYGKKYLLNTSIDEIALKTRLLAEHILNMSSIDLVVNHSLEVPNEKFLEYKSNLEKLKNNVPVQYLINKQEFMGLNFYVDENVLIPQPDTEILVENVIEYCSKLKAEDAKNVENIAGNVNTIHILDLCTGSGAIAVSLAKYIENCKITASDISTKALQIAKLNAEKNMVHKKITFVESNMFENIEKSGFDIIVSNPPYIETETIKTLSKEVQHEPILALDGGSDGLGFYRIIINEAHSYLNNNGALFLEIGFNQKKSVTELIENSKKYKNVKCIKDLAGNDRVICFQ